MEIRKTLQPGDMGTKRLLKKYGEQLVCVRYRIDKLSQKRFTTVELIIDEKPYIRTNPNINAWVKINFNETKQRQQVKTAGAKWSTEHKVWIMDYEIAKKLGLKKRIIKIITKTNG